MLDGNGGRDFVPTATYRFQLTSDFGFSALRTKVEYLQRLGVSTIYTSPILHARAGSRHGYDVVDPTKLNPELGSREELDELVASAHAAGLDLLVDIVPNHMAANAQNPWWNDVLRQGPDSPYASYFDVDWSGGLARENLTDKILLPILGRPYGDVLEDQEIRIGYDKGSFRVEYYDRRLPLNFTSYIHILHEIRQRLIKREQSRVAEPLEPILITLNEWSRPEIKAPEPSEVRNLHHRIDSLYRDQSTFRESLEDVLRVLNGKKGSPDSFDELDTILDEQSYRLSFWRNAAEEINYRRFFDITDLISIRVSDPEVFAAVHDFILNLVEQGAVSGLRLDHVDGLYDPVGYLEMLGERLDAVAPSTLVITEKILGENEQVPESFQYRGTTGYEFARALDRIFVDPAGFEILDRAFAEISDYEHGFQSVARDSKIRVMRELFRGELATFTRRLSSLTAEDRHAKDLPPSALENALVELIASLPVYRTYVRDESVLDQDLEILDQSVREALRHLEGEAAASALHFLHRVLRLETDDETQRREWLRFTMRLQQFTGPVAAKGIEDTALYIHTPLASLNEVGSEPAIPGDPIAAFHVMNQRRLSITPKTLNATSTHDTKRGEDTRCRLHVLSEFPEDWLRLFAACRPRRASSDTRSAPSAAERWLFLQTLIGIWPVVDAEWADLADRIATYIPKALREAKVHSRWTAIDEEWERLTVRWVLGLLEDGATKRAIRSLEDRTAFFGMINSLAMATLKIASPGIPDVYQGSEMFNLSLVDPDNRRTIDFARRSAALEQMETRSESSTAIEDLLAELRTNWRDGRIKLWTVWRSLLARRDNPSLFLEGDYIGLEVVGHAAGQIVAFARRSGKDWAVAIAPVRTATLCRELRFPLGEETWSDTRIILPAEAPSEWISTMSGRTIRAPGEIPIANVLNLFPADILTDRS